MHAKAASGNSETYSSDKNSFLRQAFLDGEYLKVDQDPPVWLFDTDAQELLEFTPGFNNCNLHVELRHMNFEKHPIVNEEYVVKLE